MVCGAATAQILRRRRSERAEIVFAMARIVAQSSAGLKFPATKNLTRQANENRRGSGRDPLFPATFKIRVRLLQLQIECLGEDPVAPAPSSVSSTPRC